MPHYQIIYQLTLRSLGRGLKGKEHALKIWDKSHSFTLNQFQLTGTERVRTTISPFESTFFLVKRLFMTTDRAGSHEVA